MLERLLSLALIYLSVLPLCAQQHTSLDGSYSFKIAEKRLSPITILRENLTDDKRFDTIILRIGKYQLNGRKQHAIFEVNENGINGIFSNSQDMEWAIKNNLVSSCKFKYDGKDILDTVKDSVVTREVYIGDKLSRREKFFLTKKNNEKRIVEEYDQSGILEMIHDRIDGTVKRFWSNGNMKSCRNIKKMKKSIMTKMGF